MTARSLEQRVAKLEIRYAELLRLIQNRPSSNWRSVVGMFADDPHIEELHEEMRRIRDEDRKSAKREGEV
ncbi:MAG: hypothetical protein K8T91_17630 [Planctomycetes bacterium]|nr:hypothetical protein [Planctomycetota bacterium]